MKCLNTESGACPEQVSGPSYASCPVGGHIIFGSYPQGKKGEVHPLVWRVLARESDRLLLVSRYGLDFMFFKKKPVDSSRARGGWHFLLKKMKQVLAGWLRCVGHAGRNGGEREDNDWSQSTMRSWLNGEFLEKAFNKEERDLILETTLSEPYSSAPAENLPGGTSTSDKVFLLSLDEADRYFSGDADRCCQPTPYLERQWTCTLGEEDAENLQIDAACAGNCCWRLRSPGSKPNFVAGVGYTGSLSDDFVTDVRGAVRPALYLALR